MTDSARPGSTANAAYEVEASTAHRALPALAGVVAAGARTPIGLNAQQTGMLFRAGFPAMGYAPIGPDGADVTICLQGALKAELEAEARKQALAGAALSEVLAQLAPLTEKSTPGRVLLLLGLDPIEDTHHADERDRAVALARWLLAQCQRCFPATQLDLVLAGGAGPCAVLPSWLHKLNKGEIDLIVLGGVHSDCDRAVIARLIAEERLYADDNLDAILPGESAAFVALTSQAYARHMRLPISARLCGAGHGSEAARFHNELPSAPAQGATAAMRQATAPLEQHQLQAGWLLSDLGFEAWRMREYQTVHVRAHNVLGPPYRADNPAHRLGRLGASAVPLMTALAAEAFERRYAPSPIALITAGSETTDRGALVLTAP